ncbi:hypothetical protein CNEO4_2170001 [Clostridium neonatale]|nr:hypothetical protein CNEO4_2170001 [Clostridium neonatale]
MIFLISSVVSSCGVFDLLSKGIGDGATGTLASSALRPAWAICIATLAPYLWHSSTILLMPGI